MNATFLLALLAFDAVWGLFDLFFKLGLSSIIFFREELPAPFLGEFLFRLLFLDCVIEDENFDLYPAENDNGLSPCTWDFKFIELAVFLSWL